MADEMTNQLPEDEHSSEGEIVPGPEDASSSPADGIPSEENVLVPETQSATASAGDEETEAKRLRCRYCGQLNQIRAAVVVNAKGTVRCGRCRLPLSDEPHQKFHQLDPYTYIHPLDSQALRTLKMIPGIDPILKKLLELTGESYLRVMFSANGVRVTERQCPDLHAKLEVVCTTLGIEKPELYLSVTNPLAGGGGLGFNAFTSGVEKPFIVVFTPLLERLDDTEVLAVLAHEAGHIHCNHLLYKVAAELLFLLANTALGVAPLPPGVAELITFPIRAALLTWYQKSELSCDRAAQLVTQDSRVLINVMMKLAGGTMTSKINSEEFIQQARDFDRSNEQSYLNTLWTNLIASGRTHPFPVWRVSEILKWTEDPDGYQKLITNATRSVTA